MKTASKKGGRPLPRKTAIAAKLTKINPEREIVQRLQYVLAEIDRLPLPIGKLGCAFLDCLELCDKIRDKARQKARELLLKEPGMIPNWQATEGGPVRTLLGSALDVFGALSVELEDPPLTLENFTAACSIHINSVHDLIAEHKPELSEKEVGFEVNRILEDLFVYRKSAPRLIRSKDKQIELSL